MGRLQGRNALVTGGARGLGEAQCQALVREGARVVIADIDVAAGDALAARINGEGGHALALELDVTNESQWERVMQLATEELGALDILVNNAGIAALGSAEDTTLEDWRRVMAVNLDGVFLGIGNPGGTRVKQHGPGVVQHGLQVVHEIRGLLLVVQHKQVVARVGPFVFVAEEAGNAQRNRRPHSAVHFHLRTLLRHGTAQSRVSGVAHVELKKVRGPHEAAKLGDGFAVSGRG